MLFLIVYNYNIFFMCRKYVLPVVLAVITIKLPIICMTFIIYTLTTLFCFYFPRFVWLFFVYLFSKNIFYFCCCWRYYKNSYIKSIAKFSHQIFLEKILYKKFIQLFEDNCVLLANDEKESKFSDLKKDFSSLCLSCFFDFRKSTLLLKNQFPLKADVDNDLICLLPDDLFDSFKETKTLNLKLIKVLIWILFWDFSS